MAEMNAIFGGSMLITSKTQGKKIQREISLAQQIEQGRWMRWSDDYISFGPEDRPNMELSERNLPLIIKILIGRHKVATTLIDSGASLNLMMSKTIIEMGLKLSDLTHVHDTFHGIIPGQASTPIGRIDLKVSCGTGENKRMEILTFEVANFNIGYKCILGRPILLRFMAVIHSAYATIKIPGPRGVITLQSDHRDALVCENAALTHARMFSEKEAQNLAAKVAKMHEGGASARTVTPKPSAGDTPKMLVAKKGMIVTPTSTQHATDQPMADERKGATDKEIQVDPSDDDKKLRIITELEAK
jgi:hypothetical protein